MAKLRDYVCQSCKSKFEFLHHPADEQAFCPNCKSTDLSPVPGGKLLTAIIPDYPGCKRNKAGYVHTHGDRPAEKISSSVPRNFEGAKK